MLEECACRGATERKREMRRQSAVGFAKRPRILAVDIVPCFRAVRLMSQHPRDTRSMANREYADLFDIATKQGRHLDMLVLGMLRFVFLVASAEIIYILRLQKPVPTINEIVLIFFPIAAAYLLCTSMFFTKSLLAGNPQSNYRDHPQRDDPLQGLEPWRFAQLHSSGSNWFRKQVLLSAILFLAIAPIVFADVVASAGNKWDDPGFVSENYWAVGAFGVVAVLYIIVTVRVLSHRPKPKSQDVIRDKAVIDLEARRADIGQYLDGGTMQVTSAETDSHDNAGTPESARPTTAPSREKRRCCSTSTIENRDWLMRLAVAALACVYLYRRRSQCLECDMVQLN